MSWNRTCSFVAVLLPLLGSGCGGAPEESATLANQVPGTSMLSGKVSAPAPFTAAKVYAHHLERNIIYMVYTASGSYLTVAMFPGTYEVWVEKPGFASDRSRVQIEVGERADLDFTLRETEVVHGGQGSFLGMERGELAKQAELLGYDELYPDHPIKPLLENTCIQCHGQSFLAFFHRSAKEWDETIGRMLENRIPPGTVSPEQRRQLAGYLNDHFGSDSPDRQLRMDVEIPLDEEALGQAQYVEYLIPLDETRPKRWLQEVHLDVDGNVWYTERTPPHAVGRLDPRTGEVREWVLPDPEADPHGLTIDSRGYVYWAEVDKGHLGRLDPQTGEMKRYPYDPTGTEGFLGGHTPVLDSKENVWFTLIYGDGLGKWDRETEAIQVWRVPTKKSMPYGMDIGPDDTPALAELYGCRVAVFDRAKETFTEYPALVPSPCKTRRLGIDSRNVIWYGVFSQGKLGRIDRQTGEQVEYDMASRFAEPYSVLVDRNTDRIWMSDGGMGGTLISFDQDTEKFTYYPTPRRSDMPKIDTSRDGNVWYSTRAIPEGGVGVLYPDKSRITSLAASR